MLGTVLTIIGLGFVIGGCVASVKVQDGYDSLRLFLGTEGHASHNEDGQLIDHGATETAGAILSLL